MSSQEVASKPANSVSASSDTPDVDTKAPSSLALQLICAIGVLGFSGYMFSSWHRTLVQHSLAQQAQPETPVVQAAAMAPVEPQAQPPITQAQPPITQAQPPVTQPQITANTASVTPAAAPTVETAAPMVTEAAPPPAITDSATLASLSQKLYEQIDGSWNSYPTFTSNLVYQVQVQQDGAIASYDSLNKPAEDYLGETPLPELSAANPAVAETSTQPQAKFLVLLMPSGTLEISPWVGN